MNRVVIVVFLMLQVALIGEGQNSPPAPQASSKENPQAKQEAAKNHKRLVTDLSGFEMSDPKTTHKERAQLGATRGGSSRLPILLAPELTRYYGAAPLLSWLYPGRSDGFEIEFHDEEDNEMFRQQVKGTQFRFSDRVPKFADGKTYYWSVQSFPPLLEPSFSNVAGLVVVSSDERKQIEQELAQTAADGYGDSVARAEVFTRHRLWYDALGAYTDLIARFPDRAELYEKRGMIYAQIEITKPLADADFGRADELKSSAGH